MQDTSWIGRIVQSRKGRDEGRLYIVESEIDPYCVRLIDGGKFNFARTKRKNRKHLTTVATVDEVLAEAILHQDVNCLGDIRKLLELTAREV